VQIASFIDQKAKQLAFYLSAFWRGELSHAELQLFFWDTLEEWAQVEDRTEPYSQKERVFWHVLHQLHYWPEPKLAHDTILHDELSNCLHYLEGRGLCPFDCVGIRP
jgi:hypothetical protein